MLEIHTSHAVGKPCTAQCNFSVNMVSMKGDETLFSIVVPFCDLQLYLIKIKKNTFIVLSAENIRCTTHMMPSLISSCPYPNAPDPVHLLPSLSSSYCDSLPPPPPTVSCPYTECYSFPFTLCNYFYVCASLQPFPLPFPLQFTAFHTKKFLPNTRKRCLDPRVHTSVRCGAASV